MPNKNDEMEQDITSLPNYELTIDDISLDGVTAISIVEFPAIEENFLVFSKQKEPLTFAKTSEDKKLIIGPALVSDKLIYRVNPFTGEEYNIFFTQETIKKISEDFLIKQKNSNITLEHQMNVNDVSLVESWIVDNPENDKSNDLGYKLPKGSWMISLKFNNDEVWNNFVKNGKVKGISVEGYFTTLFDKFSKEIKTEDDLIVDEIKKLLNIN